MVIVHFLLYGREENSVVFFRTRGPFTTRRACFVGPEGVRKPQFTGRFHSDGRRQQIFICTTVSGGHRQPDVVYPGFHVFVEGFIYRIGLSVSKIPQVGIAVERHVQTFHLLIVHIHEGGYHDKVCLWRLVNGNRLGILVGSGLVDHRQPDGECSGLVIGIGRIFRIGNTAVAKVPDIGVCTD